MAPAAKRLCFSSDRAEPQLPLETGVTGHNHPAHDKNMQPVDDETMRMPENIATSAMDRAKQLEPDADENIRALLDIVEDQIKRQSEGAASLSNAQACAESAPSRPPHKILVRGPPYPRPQCKVHPPLLRSQA